MGGQGRCKTSSVSVDSRPGKYGAEAMGQRGGKGKRVRGGAVCVNGTVNLHGGPMVGCADDRQSRGDCHGAPRGRGDGRLI